MNHEKEPLPEELGQLRGEALELDKLAAGKIKKGDARSYQEATDQIVEQRKDEQELDEEKLVGIKKKELHEMYPFEEIYEKNKNNFRHSISSPDIINDPIGIYKKFEKYDLSDEEYKKIIKIRYEETIEYLAIVEALKVKYVDSNIPELEKSFAKYLISTIDTWKSATFNSRIFNLGSEERDWRRSGSKAYVIREDLSPFTPGIVEYEPELVYRCVDTISEMKPDVIMPLPKSGIFPAFILKEIVKELAKSGRLPNNYKPIFKIPINKTYAWSPESEGWTERWPKRIKQKRKKYTKKHEDLLEYLESVVLKLHSEQKNKILIFDEWIHHGRGSEGLRGNIKLALENLKQKGLVPHDFNLETNIITLGSERLSYNRPGKGFITDDDYGHVKKGGSKLKNWIVRRIFHEAGRRIAHDWQLLRDLRDKAGFEK